MTAVTFWPGGYFLCWPIWKSLPEKGTFFRLNVSKRVGISGVEVYEPFCYKKMTRRRTVSMHAKGTPFLFERVGSQRGASPYETRAFSHARVHLRVSRVLLDRPRKNRVRSWSNSWDAFWPSQWEVFSIKRLSIHLVWTKIESGIEGDYWKAKITLIYDKSLLSDQPPWRSLTSRYHGSKIFRSQQFFLTGTTICIVER